MIGPERPVAADWSDQTAEEEYGPRWTWLFLAGPFIWLVFFLLPNAAMEGCSRSLVFVVWVVVGLVGATVLGVGVYSSRAAAGGGRLWEATSTRGALLIGVTLLTVTVLVGMPFVTSPAC